MTQLKGPRQKTRSRTFLILSAFIFGAATAGNAQEFDQSPADEDSASAGQQQEGFGETEEQAIFTLDDPVFAETSIVDTVKKREDLRIFAEILKAVNYDEQLSGAGTYQSEWTLLAPSDEAFENLDPSLLEYIKSAENRMEVMHIIDAHLIRDRHTLNDLQESIDVPNMNFETVSVESGDAIQIQIGEHRASVIESDIEAENDSVIHVVDNLLVAIEAGRLKPDSEGLFDL